MEKKTVICPVRFSKEEMEEIEKVLTIRGFRNRSKGIREAIFQYVNNPPLLSNEEFQAIYEQLDRIRVESSRVGGNFNQIARYLNEGRSYAVDGELLRRNHAELKSVFDELMLILKDVQDAVGRRTT